MVAGSEVAREGQYTKETRDRVGAHLLEQRMNGGCRSSRESSKSCFSSSGGWKSEFRALGNVVCYLSFMMLDCSRRLLSGQVSLRSRVNVTAGEDHGAPVDSMVMPALDVHKSTVNNKISRHRQLFGSLKVMRQAR